MKRPNIIEIQTGEELKKWYWLKEELISLCKTRGILYGGSKFEILNRLAETLDLKSIQTFKKPRVISSFDWHSSHLTKDTLITDSYKNTQNVRRFFQTNCDANFKFNIAFMAFMKANVGKTLADAFVEYKNIKSNPTPSVIPDGNQYNQYMRDFFLANPTLKISDARKCWKAKKALPLIFHRYEESDLGFL